MQWQTFRGLFSALLHVVRNIVGYSATCFKFFKKEKGKKKEKSLKTQ
jgi:hypothetical protein